MLRCKKIPASLRGTALRLQRQAALRNSITPLSGNARLQPRLHITEIATRARPSRLTVTAAKRTLAPHLYSLLPEPLSQQLRPETSFTRAVKTWQRILERILPLGGCSEGNEVEVFADGDAAFRAIMNAIDTAQHRILYETFIFASDPLGKRILSKLGDAARRGVKVTLLVDGAGSMSLIHGGHLAELSAEPNASVVVFNPLFQWPFSRKHGHSLWFRNHRKIAVVDDVVAFAGGLNTAKECVCAPRLRCCD